MHLNIIHKLSKNSSLLRYLTTGGLAFAADYGILLIAYYLLSLPLGVATSLGYAIGFAISFLGNRNWVFGQKAKEKHIAYQTAQYVALLVLNYLVTVFGIRFLNEQGIKPYIGKLLIMALIVCWNYVVFKKVIFTDKVSEGKTG